MHLQPAYDRVFAAVGLPNRSSVINDMGVFDLATKKHG
jgi:hypothetical protein